VELPLFYEGERLVFVGARCRGLTAVPIAGGGGLVHFVVGDEVMPLNAACGENGLVRADLPAVDDDGDVTSRLRTATLN
jgi:hypothetical protein